MGKTLNSYLVVGTGRSGTSTTARILHEKLNIFMGDEFVPANDTNKAGFYEDLGFYRFNNDFLNNNTTYGRWLWHMLKFIEDRRKLGKPWGIKYSRMPNIMGFYLSLIDNPLIIYCYRDVSQVIKSLKRCYGHDDQRAKNLYYGRTEIIKRLLKGRGYLKIDFSNKLSDEEIITRINEWKVE